MDQVDSNLRGQPPIHGIRLVARDSQVIFSKGYGSANLEWDVPNTPATKFRLGSVTKQFTAASILLLEERGKLSVNDPVKKYLPGAPAAWDKITIFHLLTHTSGHSELHQLSGLPEARTVCHHAGATGRALSRQAARFRARREVAIQQFRICAAQLPDRKDHRGSYEKFVRENIFAPLGMKDSGYDSNSAVIPHRASGYCAGPGRFRERRLHPHEHSARRRRALFHNRGPAEVGAGPLRRQAA